ncbi:MAG: SDR family oxidoreductase [Planctomycetaceae bacterium]|nr:SDR family oxidoreductase [Planctomycetaceae bacterium]
MNITNRIAMITGGGSGIGSAVAMELANRGARAIVLVDMSEGVHQVAASINAEAGRPVAEGLVGNVTDDDFRRHCFDHASAKYGVPQILVPAAGITRDSLSVKLNKETGVATIYPRETFEQVVDVNLVSPVYWALEAVARLAQDRHQRGAGRWEPQEEIQGAIILIGSVSSQGNKGQISYAASKAGLEGVAATLNKEAMFYGVRCALIHPGFTDTPMVRAMGEEVIEKHVLPYTQLRRLIRPKEIADAICFLISNSAVSGELWADAGWHPQA